MGCALDDGLPCHRRVSTPTLLYSPQSWGIFIHNHKPYGIRLSSVSFREHHCHILSVLPQMPTLTEHSLHITRNTRKPPKNSAVPKLGYVAPAITIFMTQFSLVHAPALSTLLQSPAFRIGAATLLCLPPVWNVVV